MHLALYTGVLLAAEGRGEVGASINCSMQCICKLE